MCWDYFTFYLQINELNACFLNQMTWALAGDRLDLFLGMMFEMIVLGSMTTLYGVGDWIRVFQSGVSEPRSYVWKTANSSQFWQTFCNARHSCLQLWSFHVSGPQCWNGCKLQLQMVGVSLQCMTTSWSTCFPKTVMSWRQLGGLALALSHSVFPHMRQMQWSERGVCWKGSWSQGPGCDQKEFDKWSWLHLFNYV